MSFQAGLLCNQDRSFADTETMLMMLLRFLESQPPVNLELKCKSLLLHNLLYKLCCGIMHWAMAGVQCALP